MSIEDTIKTLHTLHSELCAALRRGEMAWYGMAGDYQTKYAFSADYDPAFKRKYLKQASTCLGLAQWLETLALPTTPEEATLFANTLKEAIARCPRPPEIHNHLESLERRIESAASAASTVEKE